MIRSLIGLVLVKKDEEYYKVYCNRCKKSDIVLVDDGLMVYPEGWGIYDFHDKEVNLCVSCTKKFMPLFYNFLNDKKKTTKNVLKLDIDIARMISEHYQFSFAVFFLPKESWEENEDKTRIEMLMRESDKLDCIRAMLEDEG